MKNSKRIIFELNEFNVDLLEESSSSRPYLKKILNSNKINTKIPDSYESDYLEPWSQWVSIHTGKRTLDHKIKHLGDVGKLRYPEIWDNSPDDFGVIWGCLNSKSPKSNEVTYFPDPWTKSSNTNLKTLQKLEHFLRLAVSDRGDGFFKKIYGVSRLVYAGIKIAPFLLSNLDMRFVKLIIKTYPSVLLNISSIYACIEYLAFNKFLKVSSIRNKSVDVFFANMQAHCQHYYWGTKNHARIDFSLDLIELMLSKLFAKYHEVVMINGLTQEYSADKEVWNIFYPKIGWEKFILNFVGKNINVQPCMSYDAILRFETEYQLEEAIKKINAITHIESKKNIFLIERYDDDCMKLFIRFNYTGLDEGNISTCTGEYSFIDLFTKLATRTARHIPICNVFLNFNLETEYQYNWELIDLYKPSDV